MKLYSALGWALPMEEFHTSPFFDGIDEDEKGEFLYGVLSKIKGDQINHVTDGVGPIWLYEPRTILRPSDTLWDLVRFVGPTPDYKSHIFFWPSWHGIERMFRDSNDIDHALYGDDYDMVFKKIDEAWNMYGGRGRMDLNGVGVGIEGYYALKETAVNVPNMLRSWIGHLGLLDQRLMSQLRLCAARYWS